ncbi:MAG: phage terminase small subunit [Romboutsia timonensis]
MARAPNEKVKKAKELYDKGYKLVDIAKELDVAEGTVRSWKNRYKWNCNATLQNNICNVANKGGAPKENSNAETHGFFSKYLPKETLGIIQEIEVKNPLDILWENIQIQYAAIIRAQNIMLVKNQEDHTKMLVKEQNGDTSSMEEWEIQYSWDKQATFLQAQSRAMKTLESMIKNYDELIHKNWELATEEQKERINVLKSKINKDNDSKEDKLDKYFEALEGEFKDD